MNDLKTKFQERMGHEYLRDPVWWHNLKSKRLISHAEWEAAVGRTLVCWSRAGHRRHQAHTQLSPDTIQLVTRSAPDDRPDDDGETVPADSCQDLCKLAEQWQRLILILIFNLNHFYNNKNPPLRLACVSTQRPTQRPSRGYVGCFVSTHPPCCVGFLAVNRPCRLRRASLVL
jgi:hypothetical protein